jgi:tubulin polyglutamylase TTLL4
MSKRISVRASGVAKQLSKAGKVINVKAERDSESDAGSEDEDEDDEDGDDVGDDDPTEEAVDSLRDPPEGCVRLRPSQYVGLPSSIYFEYPRELQVRRNDEFVLEKLGTRKLFFKCYWERICIKNAFTRAGFSRIDPSMKDDNMKYWTAMWGKHQNSSQIKSLNCLQKVNHFPASWCIGRKDRLVRTINTMKRTHPGEFDIHPDSFILPSERDAFLRAVKMDVATCKSQGGPVKKSTLEKCSLWIIKPVASSCGRGIRVITSSEALAMGKKKKALLQRYLARPYLIDGRKFDLRIYVLVSGVDPMRVYVHSEGLTRISTNKYSLNNTQDRFAHLTNYTINKKAPNYQAASVEAMKRDNKANGEVDGNDADRGGEASEWDGMGEAPSGYDGSAADVKAPEADGNMNESFKWSLGSFKVWLAQREGKAIMVETFRKINDLLVKTMIAAESEITPKLHADANYRSNCYELFGCDVILDRQLNPTLLEVNVSPSLMGSSPLDKRIKGLVMADVFHTVGLYPYDAKVLRKFDVEQHDNDVPTFDREGAVKGAGNPFTFQSLGKMMASQDKWRKTPEPGSIDFAALSPEWKRYLQTGTSGRRSSRIDGSAAAQADGDMATAAATATTATTAAPAPAPAAPTAVAPAPNYPRTPHSAPWVMLLLADDEFRRAEKTKFKCLHPSPSKAEHYVKLYRMARFSDHLLARWVTSGGATGKLRKYIPARYLQDDQRRAQREDLEREKESKRYRSSSVGRPAGMQSSAQREARGEGGQEDESSRERRDSSGSNAHLGYRKMPRPLSSSGLYLGRRGSSGRTQGLPDHQVLAADRTEIGPARFHSQQGIVAPVAMESSIGLAEAVERALFPSGSEEGSAVPTAKGQREKVSGASPAKLRNSIQQSSRDMALEFLDKNSDTSALNDSLPASPVQRPIMKKEIDSGNGSGSTSPLTVGAAGITVQRPASANNLLRRNRAYSQAGGRGQGNSGDASGAVVPRPPSGGTTRFSRSPRKDGDQGQYIEQEQPQGDVIDMVERKTITAVDKKGSNKLLRPNSSGATQRIRRSGVNNPSRTKNSPSSTELGVGLVQSHGANEGASGVHGSVVSQMTPMTVTVTHSSDKVNSAEKLQKQYQHNLEQQQRRQAQVMPSGSPAVVKDNTGRVVANLNGAANSPDKGSFSIRNHLGHKTTYYADADSGGTSTKELVSQAMAAVDESGKVLWGATNQRGGLGETEGQKLVPTVPTLKQGSSYGKSHAPRLLTTRSGSPEVFLDKLAQDWKDSGANGSSDGGGNVSDGSGIDRGVYQEFGLDIAANAASAMNACLGSRDIARAPPTHQVARSTDRIVSTSSPTLHDLAYGPLSFTDAPQFNPNNPGAFVGASARAAATGSSGGGDGGVHDSIEAEIGALTMDSRMRYAEQGDTVSMSSPAAKSALRASPIVHPPDSGSDAIRAPPKLLGVAPSPGEALGTDACSNAGAGAGGTYGLSGSHGYKRIAPVNRGGTNVGSGGNTGVSGLGEVRAPLIPLSASGGSGSGKIVPVHNLGGLGDMEVGSAVAMAALRPGKAFGDRTGRADRGMGGLGSAVDSGSQPIPMAPAINSRGVLSSGISLSEKLGVGRR